jgi:hypothetical protein
LLGGGAQALVAALQLLKLVLGGFRRRPVLLYNVAPIIPLTTIGRQHQVLVDRHPLQSRYFVVNGPECGIFPLVLDVLEVASEASGDDLSISW